MIGIANGDVGIEGSLSFYGVIFGLLVLIVFLLLPLSGQCLGDRVRKFSSFDLSTDSSVRVFLAGVSRLDSLAGVVTLVEILILYLNPPKRGVRRRWGRWCYCRRGRHGTRSCRCDGTRGSKNPGEVS